MVQPARAAIATSRALTPEEDAIDDPEADDDAIDDLLPADLWFRRRGGSPPGSRGGGVVYSRPG